MTLLESLKHRPGYDAWMQDNALGDVAGTPQVWFHGTNAPEDFTVFAMCEDLSVGFHFGSVQAAETRIDHIGENHKRIIPVLLRATNPVRIRDCFTWDLDEIVSELMEQGRMSEALAVWVIESADLSGLYAALDHLGIDALLYPNVTEGGGDSVFVWHAHQIRSVFSNDLHPGSPCLLSQQPGDPEDLEMVDRLEHEILVSRRELQKLGFVGSGGTLAPNTKLKGKPPANKSRLNPSPAH